MPSAAECYGRPVVRTALVGTLLLAAALPAPALAAGENPSAVAPQARICASPGKDWERAAPEELGLNRAKLTDALKFADSRLSASAMLIRHGCLAGISPNGQANYFTRQESWSMAKSMVSMAALRAMTLGLLSPDDRVGALIPEADAEHGAITVRQLLEMSSGLHWNLLGDYGNVFNPDIVTGALQQPFDSSPGTEFVYHQAAVTLLTKVIERAVGTPFRDWIQRELFGPIGIARSSWTWATDNAGNTAGFYGLQMPAGHFARLGQLMLRKGNWNGRVLIDPSYVAAAHAPSPTNARYGWLFWLPGDDPLNPPAVPADTYSMQGLFNQTVVIIPSLDTVYVRLGLPSSDFAKQDAVKAIMSDEGQYNIARKFMNAFVDPDLPDVKAYTIDPDAPTSIGGLEDGQDAHPEEVFATLAPVKPPLPPAGPKRGRVPVTPGGTLAVDDRGRATIPVSCPLVAETPCRASLVITTASGRPLSSPARATIPIGAATTVRVRLSSSSRKRLRLAQRGKLDARVTIYVGDSASRWSSVAVPPITLAMAN